MDQKVVCSPERMPSWPALAQLLAGRGIPLTLRMIDNQLAFPDEEPPADWQELRVSTPAGMVTLRREPDDVRLVIWGNADPELLHCWSALSSAITELAGDGADPQAEVTRPQNPRDAKSR
jgi:hypothetical protein